MSKKQIEMFFDIGHNGGINTLVPICMVGDKHLRLDTHLNNVNEAKTFMQAFIIGNSVGGPQEFLDLYAEREYQKVEDEAKGVEG